MTQAPERITTSACAKQIVQDGMKRFDTDIDWVRLDHHEAVVAAEREACAELAQFCLENPEGETVSDRKYAIEYRILAREDDATEALERVKREARNEALREAADVLTDETELSRLARKAILVLITEGQSDAC